MSKLIPIKQGDFISVIAPANPMSTLAKDLIQIGVNRIKSLGYNVKFGKYVNDEGIYGISSVENRLEDIHSAYRDPTVSMIMAVFGGYNSNQLLDQLDFDLIKEKKKIIIGYSDITSLLNAIYTKTGMYSLYGISFASLCDPNIFDESVHCFQQIITGESNIVLTQPPYFADDLWYLKDNYGPRELNKHPGWVAIQEGKVQGKLIGGNLETFLSLAGTPYFPNVEGHILLIESSFNESTAKFVRLLTQLKQMNVFDQISGLIIGQFNKHHSLSDSNLLKQVLQEFIGHRPIPVLSNVNLSHVDPLYTVPIGSEICIEAFETSRITILDSIYE